MKTSCVEQKPRKQRLYFELCMNYLIIKSLLQECDAKIADVWSIESIWGILKKIVWEEQFSSFK